MYKRQILNCTWYVKTCFVEQQQQLREEATRPETTEPETAKTTNSDVFDTSRRGKNVSAVVKSSSRDKSTRHVSYRVGRGGKRLLCDPGSEFRLKYRYVPKKILSTRKENFLMDADVSLMYCWSCSYSEYVRTYSYYL